MFLSRFMVIYGLLILSPIFSGEKSSLPPRVLAPPIEKTTSLLIEYWHLSSANAGQLSAFRAEHNFPHSPHRWEYTESLEFDFSNLHANYGARLRGFICPRETLQYNFWLSTNVAGFFALSTDERPENLQPQITLNRGVRKYDYDEIPAQKSPSVLLTAGKKYYFEILYLGGARPGGHLQLAWSSAKRERKIIPPECLSIYDEAVARIPAPENIDAVLVSDQMVELNWDMVKNGGVIEKYLIRRDGKKIAEVMARSYIDVTVEPQRKHLYTLTAVNLSGKSSRASQEKAVIIPPYTGANGTGATVYFTESNDFLNLTKISNARWLQYNAANPEELFDRPRVLNNTPYGIGWRGEIVPRYDEEYTFTADIGGTDLFRLVIGNEIVIDRWHHKQTVQQGTIKLSAGKRYPLSVQYYTYNQQKSAKKLPFCRVLWRSRSQPAMPISARQLYPLADNFDNEVALTIPKQIDSHISPAWIEGEATNGVREIVADDGDENILVQILPQWSDKKFFLSTDKFFGIELSAGKSKVVKLQAIGERRTNACEVALNWRALPLMGKTNEVVHLRLNDKLLVTGGKRAGELCLTDAKQKIIAKQPIGAFTETSLHFTNSGKYDLTFRTISNPPEVLGTLTINVYIARPQFLPCETNFIGLFPAITAAQILKIKNLAQENWSLTPFDVRCLYIAKRSDGALAITPHQRTGDLRYLLRIPGGAGITIGTVSAFNFHYESTRFTHLLTPLSDGTHLLFSRIYLKPHVPNVEVRFNTIVSGLTLENSRTVMKIPSSAIPVNADGDGEYKLIILRTPQIANKACHARQAFFYNCPISFRE